jgi:hypothetical protein
VLLGGFVLALGPSFWGGAAPMSVETPALNVVRIGVVESLEVVDVDERDEERLICHIARQTDYVRL